MAKLTQIKSKLLSALEFRELLKAILLLEIILGLRGDTKMSFNMDKQYYLWINDTTDQQIGKNLQLNNFYLIEGWVTDDKNKSITHDFIVTEQDEKALYGNIISSDKKHF